MTAPRGLIAALLVGIACRVAQYAACTSIWHDEAFVALNVRHVPVAGLRGPLGWHEPSPPGFLLFEKIAVAIGGENEWALRALPLLAGVLALCVFARLARRVSLSPSGAVLAVLLLAASDKLIADASLVKHFSLDLLAAASLIDLAYGAASAPTPARLLAWGIVAALAPWLSYASTFVAAGTAAVLAPVAWRASAPTRRAAAIVVTGVLGSALFLAGAVQAQRSGAVVSFWMQAFPPLDGGVLAVAIWLGRALVGAADYLWRPLGGLLLIPAAFAVAAYHRHRPPLVPMLLLPIGIALVASAMRWWPFGSQHMAFAAPALFLLAGDGMVGARLRLPARRQWLVTIAGAVLLGPGIGLALFHLAVPRERHDLRPAIAFMQGRREAGDELAVFDPATFEFYAGVDPRDASVDLATAPRVWVITPRSSHGALHPDVAQFVEALLVRRRRLAVFETHGAAAYLFGPLTTEITEDTEVR